MREERIPPGLNPVVTEWVTKALGDLRTARRELSARPDPNFDATCHHAQQCAEKLMKGVLINRAIVVPKTHDLVELSRLLASMEAGWTWSTLELEQLTLAAVEYRYPGASAAAPDATLTLGIAERLWPALIALL